MYEDQAIEDIKLALQQISLQEHQYEKGQSHAIKEVAISSRQPRLVCEVCTNTFTNSLDRLTHFPDGTPVCCDVIWNQTFCPKHLHDGTPICFGCMRLKTSDVTYINLGDGRETCLDCYSTAIFDIRQCEPLLVNKCHEFFHTLDIDLPYDVRVFLVDTIEMARLSGEQEPIFGLGLEADMDDMATITGVTSCSRKGNSIVVEQEMIEAREYRTGIAILFGLPKIMTQAILAHEMMHVWFRSNGIEPEKLERKLEEGMCQVIGWKWLDWLESEINSSSSTTTTSHEQTQFRRKLIETYKFVVEEHDSDEYGQGFREVESDVARFGFKTTINCMINSANIDIKN